MARRRPTLASVTSANTRAPAGLNSTDTYGSPVFWSMDTRAVVRSAPLSTALRCTTNGTRRSWRVSLSTRRW